MLLTLEFPTIFMSTLLCWHRKDFFLLLLCVHNIFTILVKRKHRAVYWKKALWRSLTSWPELSHFLFKLFDCLSSYTANALAAPPCSRCHSHVVHGGWSQYFHQAFVHNWSSLTPWTLHLGWLTKEINKVLRSTPLVIGVPALPSDRYYLYSYHSIITEMMCRRCICFSTCVLHLDCCLNLLAAK